MYCGHHEHQHHGHIRDHDNDRHMTEADQDVYCIKWQVTGVSWHRFPCLQIQNSTNWVCDCDDEADVGKMRRRKRSRRTLQVQTVLGRFAEEWSLVASNLYFSRAAFQWVRSAQELFTLLFNGSDLHGSSLRCSYSNLASS